MSQRMRVASSSGAVGVAEAKRVKHAPASGVGETETEPKSDSVDFKSSKKPPLSTLPDVRTLIIKYRPDRGSEVGRPTERLLRQMVQMDDIIGSTKDPKALAQKMLEKDIRTPLFRLEALFRLYAGKFGPPFEGALATVKALEDQLGAVGFVQDALEVAAKVALPERGVKVLNERLATEMGKLEELVKTRWTPGEKNRAPAFDEVLLTTLNANFGTNDEDNKYLRGEVSRRFEKVAGKEYDFDLLQDGLHEARRQLRWLPLYAHALDGAIQFSDQQNAIPKLKKLLDSEEAKSPFMTTAPPTREENPIVLSKSLMVANSQAVAEMGEAKDRGEFLETFAEVLHEGGAADSPKEARAMARELLGPGHRRKEFLKDGRESYQRFERLGVLKTLAREVRGE